MSSLSSAEEPLSTTHCSLILRMPSARCVWHSCQFTFPSCFLSHPPSSVWLQTPSLLLHPSFPLQNFSREWPSFLRINSFSGFLSGTYFPVLFSVLGCSSEAYRDQISALRLISKWRTDPLGLPAFRKSDWMDGSFCQSAWANGLQRTGMLGKHFFLIRLKI